MNRLISNNLGHVDPDKLPPSRRDGPVRALFIHGNILGFRTVAGQIKKYCADRADIDAVHIDLVGPTWMKVLGKSLPFPTRGWDMHSTRYLHMWRRVLRRWLAEDGPLPLSRFDVVHAMTQGNACWVPDLQRPGGPKMAICIDGTAAQDVSEFGFSRIARAPFIAAERRMFAAADLITCRNGWATQSLRKDYDVPESRIHVMRNSMALTSSHRWDGKGREHAGLARIVFAGSWVRKNGPLALRVHQRRFADKAELHIFTKKRFGAITGRNVVSHGYVDRDRLINELLPSMDIFLLPSREDMLPWAALEAASIGLPIVASRIGAIPEVVLHERTGLLCTPGSDDEFAAAIGRLLDDPALRERMGRAGRDHVARHHDPDVTYPGLLDRLVSLVDESRSAISYAAVGGEA